MKENAALSSQVFELRKLLDAVSYFHECCSYPFYNLTTFSPNTRHYGYKKQKQQIDSSIFPLVHASVTFWFIMLVTLKVI